MSNTDRFWDAMNKSVVVSSLLALIVWVAIIYLSVAQGKIPDGLMAGGSLILGFFFGARSGQQTARVQAANEALKAYATGVKDG